MEGRSQGISFQHVITGDGTEMTSQKSLEEIQCWRPNWYLTKKEIEDCSPSRRDGIDAKKETQLRKLYAGFLHDLGMKLQVPQFTIATATMFCHRFYLHQSHAKNDWQTIATVCMFLACKVEETPRLLVDVIVVAYEMQYSQDPTSSKRIKQKAVYEKQKELILIGERLLLTTIGFDMSMQHPYKPLMEALKKLNLPSSDVLKVAWNFVNDWLRTTLCLQYKPHYIAAGSLYLAAKFCKVKLPSERGKNWWLEFDVSPRQLEEVIKAMLRCLELSKEPKKSSSQEKARQPVPVTKTTLSSPQSCVLNVCKATSESNDGLEEKAGVGGRSQSGDACPGNSRVGPGEYICSVRNKVGQQCQTSDCGSSQSVVEDGSRNEEGEIQARMKESNQTASCMIVSDCGGPSEGEIQERMESNPTAACLVVSDCGGPSEGEIQAGMEKSNQTAASTIVSDCGGPSTTDNVGDGGLSKIDKDRIREALRKRKYEKAANKKVVNSLDEDKDQESWIVRELEKGVEQGSSSVHKRQRS